MDLDVRSEVQKFKEKMIGWRRDFHQHPEIGLEEVRTARVVAGELERLGLQVKTGIGRTGVVGLMEGCSPGKTLLLRADMDALPIQEQNDVPYRSVIPNMMHACGHDGHMAILLGVADILSRYRRDWPGRIKFVFQPGEEGYAGARLMIEDGAAKDPAVDAVLSLHLFTTMPLGVIGVRPGLNMASMDNFKIRIKGRAAPRRPCRTSVGMRC